MKMLETNLLIYLFLGGGNEQISVQTQIELNYFH